jgi:putative ABC transport system permease protein
VTVVGVMPAGFAFPRPGWDAYSQLQLDREDPWARNNHYLPTLARLAPGATLEQARSEMEVLAARSTEAYPDYYPGTGLRVRVRSLQDTLVGEVKMPLYVLLAAVGFVLLTVCVNVANLLLARGETRKREVAVRTAMGASRGRIIRQLFSESLLLAALGGIAGMLVALAGIRILLATAPAALPRMEEIGMDGTALVFALLATAATGLVFGVMPAFQAGRREVQDMLREGGGERGATRAGIGLRRGLVVAQVGLAVVLTTGSGLMLRSVANLYAVELGFATESILTFRITPRPSVYDTPERTVDLYRELLARVNALPGVRAAAATASLPMTGGADNWSILIEGRPVANIGEAPSDLVQQVTPEYLEAMGLTLVRGRWFTLRDDATSPPVVVVTEAMARKHWPGEDAIGKRMKVFVPEWPWMEVIGVVRDVRHQGPGNDPRPRWFVPHAQAWVSAYESPLSNTIVVRADRGPTPLVGPVQDVVRELDASIPISDVQSMEQVLDGAVGSQRFVARLLTAFGFLALFLAVVGVYGVVSHAVSRRTREIGLRVALGARTGEVISRVLGEGVALALLGVGAGLAGAHLLSTVFASLVFGVAPTDPLTYGAVASTLLGSVALASLLPALRASRISPVEALKEE